MNQVLWSANVCYLASLKKRHDDESSFDIGLKGINISSVSSEWPSREPKKAEKSLKHDLDFLVTVRIELSYLSGPVCTTR